MTLAGDNRCPLCRAALWAPDETIGAKKCPRCNAELWALAGAKGPLFFLRQPGQSKFGFLAALAAPLHGVSATRMEEILKQSDSLDLVEIVLDIEAALRGQESGVRGQDA
jgi:hypothetical protein